MKVSITFCFAVLLTINVTQLRASEIISKGGNEEIKTENGTDIVVKKPELMEIVVSNNNLTFKICTMKCKEDFLVCYEPDPPLQNTTEYVDGICDPLCGFYVTGGEKVTKSEFYVAFMNPTDRLRRNEKCDFTTMSLKKSIIQNEGISFRSCKPKIENGLVKLNVSKASSDCPVIIKNAQFKRDPTTTTVLPSSTPSGQSSSKVFGIFGWIFVLIFLCILQ